MSFNSPSVFVPHSASPVIHSHNLHIGHNSIQRSLFWRSFYLLSAILFLFLAYLYSGIRQTCLSHHSLCFYAAYYRWDSKSLLCLCMCSTSPSAIFYQLLPPKFVIASVSPILSTSHASITAGLIIGLYKRNFAALEICYYHLALYSLLLIFLNFCTLIDIVSYYDRDLFKTIYPLTFVNLFLHLDGIDRGISTHIRIFCFCVIYY